MAANLSKAQRRLLERCLKGAASSSSTGFTQQTARSLVKRGYVRPTGISGYRYSGIEITQQGIDALKASLQ